MNTELRNDNFFGTYFGKKIAEELLGDQGEDQLGIQELIFLLYLVSQEGHVCLNFHQPGINVFLENLQKRREISPPIVCRPEWRQPLTGFSALIGAPGNNTPIICDAPGVYYFQKNYHFEQKLCDHITRLTSPGTGLTAAGSPSDETAFLQCITPAEPYAKVPQHPFRSGLTVVAGGPGTGKTTAIINILIMLALRLPRRPLCFLCAPTGKAAARLSDAVSEGKKRYRGTVSDMILDRLPEKAVTLHSLLGRTFRSREIIPGERRRLVADCVIVDESSMLDLFLANDLFEGFSPNTVFVLVGDANQLSSVEAGAVFKDICRALETHPERSANLFMFSENHRFSGNEALGQLSEAVLSGRSEAVIPLLHSKTAQIKFEPNTPASLQQFETVYAAQIRKETAVLEPSGVGDYIAAGTILTPFRRGFYGCEAINGRIEKNLKAALSADKISGDWFHGRKIIITKNFNGFTNGDTGVCLQNAGGQLRVYFQDNNGLSDFPLYAVPFCESAFAVTVHKSQGSEYQHVVVVVPETGEERLHRELFYTAVTRTKNRLHIFGSVQAIEKCIEHRAERYSRLSERIIEAVLPA